MHSQESGPRGFETAHSSFSLAFAVGVCQWGVPRDPPPTNFYPGTGLLKPEVVKVPMYTSRKPRNNLKTDIMFINN